jgi:diguanylate cyclase (GGDEF)-like protein
METALAAAAAAALGVLATVLATRLLRARGERRAEPVRRQIDEHLAAIAATVDRVAALAASASARRRPELELSLDLETLLEQLVAEALALTGAQAVAVRVSGPAGAPVVASVGTGDGADLLETALGPPDARPFRALTINWTYGPAAEEDENAYSSALVVPVVEDGTTTGALVAYARPEGAFASEHLRALRELVDDAASGISTARRYAELGQRSLTDALTGIPNRNGYELELEREITRAHRTGRPLSLLLVELRDAPGVDEAPDPAESDLALQEFAALLRRTARAADIPCRRRPDEFAVVLPETRSEGARRFYSRLRAETGTAFGRSGRKTFSVGLAEWRPDETSQALDARVVAAARRGDANGLEASAGTVAAPVRLEPGRRRDEPTNGGTSENDARSQLLDHLTRAVADARGRREALAVAVLEIDAVASVAARAGEDAAVALRTHVAARIADCVDEGSAVSRLGPDRLAVVFPRATSADARSMVSVLQASLELGAPEGVGRATVSAGIGELLPADDAEALVRRAEEALTQARAAGNGTVVVARRNG